MDMVLLVSRWFHLAAAIVALGGATFTLFALMPAAKATLTDEIHDALREAIRRRWAKVVHVCVALLFITGSINFAILALPPKVHPLPYHPIFGVKFFAALGVFFIASILVGSGQRFANMRRQRRRWLGILLGLGALIVLLSGVLHQVRVNQMHPAPMAEVARTGA